MVADHVLHVSRANMINKEVYENPVLSARYVYKITNNTMRHSIQKTLE